MKHKNDDTIPEQISQELTDDQILCIINEVWCTPYEHTKGWINDHITFARTILNKQKELYG